MRGSAKLWHTAIHESGHAVIAMRNEIAVRSIAIDGEGMGRILYYGGNNAQHRGWSPAARDRVMRQMLVDLAGAASGRRLRDHQCLGAEDDYRRAHENALHLAHDVESANLLLRYAERRAMRAVAFHWTEITYVAKALIDHKRLCGKLLAKVLATARSAQLDAWKNGRDQPASRG